MNRNDIFCLIFVKLLNYYIIIISVHFNKLKTKPIYTHMCGKRDQSKVNINKYGVTISCGCGFETKGRWF